MTRTIITLVALAYTVATSSTAVQAQTTDFSGRWTLDAPPAPTTPPTPGTQPGPQRGDMGSGWGPAITIAQDAKQLAVEYSVYTRYDMQPAFKFVYALDGSESKNTVMMGRGAQMESSRASWQGSALAITTTFSVADHASGQPFTAEVTRKLSLESPNVLVVEVTRSGVLGGAASTARTVYKKG